MLSLLLFKQSLLFHSLLQYKIYLITLNNIFLYNLLFNTSFTLWHGDQLLLFVFVFCQIFGLFTCGTFDVNNGDKPTLKVADP